MRGYATISEAENSVTFETYPIWPEPADFLDRAGKGLRYPFWDRDRIVRFTVRPSGRITLNVAIRRGRYAGAKLAWEFPLPGFDQKQCECARGINSEATDPSIDADVAPLATVSGARVCAQSSYSLNGSSEAAESGTNIISNPGIEVAAIRRQAKWPLTALKRLCTSFFGGRGSPNSIRIDRQTLSIVEQAAVIASSGSPSVLAMARSRSLLTVSKTTVA